MKKSGGLKISFFTSSLGIFSLQRCSHCVFLIDPLCVTYQTEVACGEEKHSQDKILGAALEGF